MKQSSDTQPGSIRGNDEDASASGDRRRRRLVRVMWGIVGVMLVCAVWLVLVRSTRSWRAVQIFELRNATVLSSMEQTVGCLRLGAWNVGRLRGATDQSGRRMSTEDCAREVSGTLRAANLDIVVLTEVPLAPTFAWGVDFGALIASEAGFRYRVEQRNIDASIPMFGVAYGNVILSRHPILRVDHVDYPTRSAVLDWLVGTRDGSIAVIQLDDGRRIQVAAIHIESSWGGLEVRQQSLDAVARAASDDLPLVAAGDFNESLPGFPNVRASRLDSTPLSSFLQDRNLTTEPMDQPDADDLTFPAESPDRVIDWILVPATWDIITREVPTLTLSDHRPVFMEVAIPTQDDHHEVRGVK